MIRKFLRTVLILAGCCLILSPIQAADKIPVIGITATYSKNEANLIVRNNYAKAVTKAGGIPLIIPPEIPADRVEQVVNMCDGIIIPGGDIKYDANRELDKTVIGLCLKEKKPILGICRGLQRINFYLGGNNQRTPEGPVEHQVPGEYSIIAHEVKVTNDVLKNIVGSDLIEVNSRHDHCMNRQGDGVEVIAISPKDDVVEAMYVKDQPFALGVQWHPEGLTDRPEHMAIFDALIKAAKGQLRLDK